MWRSQSTLELKITEAHGFMLQGSGETLSSASYLQLSVGVL